MDSGLRIAAGKSDWTNSEFAYAGVIRNFWDRFIGKFIVTFELNEGGIPGEHWAF